MPLRPDDALGAHVASVLAPNYEVDSEIGRGGMGIVYCAMDKRLKRNVAIKLLPPERAFRADIRSRFLREAETAAQLSHPNIVPIYSVDERDGLVFFVMAYITGDNLAKRVHDVGALSIGVVTKPIDFPVLLARVRANLDLARLRTRHARWRAALLDALHEAFYLVDEAGDVVEVNAGFADLLGYGPEGLPYPLKRPWWPDEQADPEGGRRRPVPAPELPAVRSTI